MDRERLWGYCFSQKGRTPWLIDFRVGNQIQEYKTWLFFFFFFFFLGLPLQHMEFPRLGVWSELQLLAYATATAMWDPSCICDLHHSSWQCQILNPLGPGIESATSWFLVRLTSAVPWRELPNMTSYGWKYPTIHSLTYSTTFIEHLLVVGAKAQEAKTTQQ